MTLESRICGSLLLGAIGDSIGYGEMEKRRRHCTDESDFLGHFSCVTLLTLFTCEGLINGYNRGAASGISSGAEVYVDDAYLNYLHLQGYPQCGAWSRWSDLLHAGDILGKPQQREIDCVDVLLSGMGGTLDEPINSRSDCAALARCIPAGFVNQYGKRYDDAPEDCAFWQGAKICALTHGSPSGYLPGAILCDAVHHVAYEDHVALADAIESAISKAALLFPEYCSEIGEISNKVGIALKLSECGSSEMPLDMLTQNDAASVLAASIYCALSSKMMPETAFMLAVQHLSLPNALASLTGQIIGAFLGIEAIPSELRSVCSEGIVLSIAKQLAEVAGEMYSNSK